MGTVCGAFRPPCHAAAGCTRWSPIATSSAPSLRSSPCPRSRSASPLSHHCTHTHIYTLTRTHTHTHTHTHTYTYSHTHIHTHTCCRSCFCVVLYSSSLPDLISAPYCCGGACADGESQAHAYRATVGGQVCSWSSAGLSACPIEDKAHL